MDNPPLEVIILAAGKGTRMRSELPKVLHPLAGRPLLEHVLAVSRQLGASRIHVVYGYGGELLRERIPAADVNWVLQAEQLGTGHAVQLALQAVSDEAMVMVLYGDVPLVGAHSLRAMRDAAGHDGVGLMTAELADPAAYGRIIRDENQRFRAIVEYSDASDAQRAISEINTGFLAAPAGRLKHWLAAVGRDNAQGEFYLTDIFALAVADGAAVETCAPVTEAEILGVNSRADLARLERLLQRQQAEELLAAGVGLADPARLDLRGELTHGVDCSIDIDVVLEGEVRCGDRVTIGPFCHLKDVTLGDDVVVHAHSVLEGASIGAGGRVGPFARVRPGSRIAAAAHIGNFVEVKNSTVGDGSKINHLAYVGDCDVGRGVNIGAGVITCNYDGAYKHRTIIGDDAFIGSDTQLVAPVRIGRGATIGAGSTITEDTPDDTLSLSRSPQVAVPGWQRPRKDRQD